MGYDVALISRPRAYRLFEGVAARTYAGLTAAGCTAALAALGDEVLRESHWNDAVSRANRERVVDRTSLDAALINDAKAAGVEVKFGRVGRYLRAGGVWRVEVHGRPGHRAIQEE